ncbi:MAG: hypothetical protein IKS41_06485 [Alphaproteobacteria bacterium]|nr:hypothetical protein [Alphaproteobacteria bacterium]
MQTLKIKTIGKKYDAVISNSNCKCNSGTGSGGFHAPEAKKIMKAASKIYKTQQKQNYRTAA